MNKSFEDRLAVGGVPTERWWLTSKTLIISILKLLSGFLLLLTGSELVQEYPEIASVGLIVLGIVDGIIRVLTNSKVTLSAPNNPPKSGTAE